MTASKRLRVVSTLVVSLFIIMPFLFSYHSCSNSITSHFGVRVQIVDASDHQEVAFHFPRLCHRQGTLVTAFYNFGNRSKHSEEEFKTWNERFFSLNDSMVVYTDLHSIDTLVRLRLRSRGCTLFLLRAITGSELWNRYDWRAQYELDPEKNIHATELYVLWNQKSLWLSEAAVLNPFEGSHFFWADAGQFRDEDFLQRFIIPNGGQLVRKPNFMPYCKLAILSIRKFTAEEIVLSPQGESKILDARLVRLGGGNFGGDLCAVQTWRDAFLAELDRYVSSGNFAGKDQPLYGSACLKKRELCFIVDGDRVQYINDVWFAMQPVLHGVHATVPNYQL